MSTINRVVISLVIGVIVISIFAWMGAIAIYPGLGGHSPLFSICRQLTSYPWDCIGKLGITTLCASPVIGIIIFAIVFFLLPKEQKD